MPCSALGAAPCSAASPKISSSSARFSPASTCTSSDSWLSSGLCMAMIASRRCATCGGSSIVASRPQPRSAATRGSSATKSEMCASHSLSTSPRNWSSSLQKKHSCVRHVSACSVCPAREASTVHCGASTGLSSLNTSWPSVSAATTPSAWATAHALTKSSPFSRFSSVLSAPSSVSICPSSSCLASTGRRRSRPRHPASPASRDARAFSVSWSTQCAMVSLGPSSSAAPATIAAMAACCCCCCCCCCGCAAPTARWW
mmetsp:Transcript_19260/g.61706  ORF Transcript_19260/g.61706 Transcript_19260/m.61706 type:complete len:258 (-) Transcript_19260:356-1129(-)